MAKESVELAPAEAPKAPAASPEATPKEPVTPILEEEEEQKETPVEGEESEEEALIEAQLTLPGLTKDENDKFVWKLRPDDAASPVYKGDTLQELLENVANNIAEKDNNYKALKASKTISPEKFKGKKPGDESVVEVNFPERGEILLNVLKERKIDPEMVSWSKEQWAELEAREGAVHTLETKQAVKEAVQFAEQSFTEANVAALNDYTLDQETQVISEMLVSEGVEITEAEYDTILEKIINDPKNYNKGGVRKQSLIVRDASRLITEKKSGVVSKQAQADALRRQIEGRKKTADVKPAPAKTSGGNLSEVTGGKYKNTSEASDASLRLLEKLAKGK